MQPQTNIDRVFNKLRQLQPGQMLEVEDFIDFLGYRSHERELVRAAQTATESVLRRVWDNDEDASYDDL